MDNQTATAGRCCEHRTELLGCHASAGSQLLREASRWLSSAEAQP